MTFDEIIEFVQSLRGVLTLRPGPGDGSPEISWGDIFFYYAPDGVVPKTQPFATMVTKDYPGDDTSTLNRPGVFRLNIAPGRDAFVEAIEQPGGGSATTEVDPSHADVVFAHPVYDALHWVCVINPAERTAAVAQELLRTAHHLARARYQRRAGDIGIDGDPEPLA